MESGLAEISFLDRCLAIFLLLLTLVGPVLVLVAMAIMRTFEKTNGGKAVVIIGVSGFTACALGWQVEVFRDDDAANVVIRSFLVPICSSICLLALSFGAGAIGRMGKDGASVKIRLLSFWIMFVAIPMGFAPIARIIDGDRGIDSTIQYFAEFLWRLSDIVSFGYLSTFDRAAYSHMVVYTSQESYSVVVFNMLVGVFATSCLVNLVKPDFSFSTFFESGRRGKKVSGD